MFKTFLICLFLSACSFGLTANRAEAACRGGMCRAPLMTVAVTAARVILPPYPIAREVGGKALGVERRQSRRACGRGLFGRCR